MSLPLATFGIASLIPSLLLMVVLSATGFSGNAWADGESPDDLSQRSVGQLEDKLSDIDERLTQLSRYSLQGGIGAIGYRSQNHADPRRTEWVEIVLPEVTTVDEVLLVPAILRDSNVGFSSDAFPVEFRVLASMDADDGSSEELTELASYSSSDCLLPRIAPLVITCNGVRARRVRIEATLLGQREFDGRSLLQLSEVLIFSDQRNVALRQTVRSSSSDPNGSPAWGDGFLVDGFVPYSMHSSSEAGSLAYVTAIDKDGEPTTLSIDLGSAQPVSQIRLHLVDQSDTVPATFSGDFGVPRLLQLVGANQPDFADAKILVEIKHENNFDVGPIVERHFESTECRYLRLVAIDPYEIFASDSYGHRLGFAEIEILASGQNVAYGKLFDTQNKQTSWRRLEALTDGRNFFGRVLPLREWLLQLAQRHELETQRPLIAAELNGRYMRQRTIMRAMVAFAAMLVIGAVCVVVIGRSQRRNAIEDIRNQIAADLHDELGGSVSALGLLSDVVQNSATSPDRLPDLMQRMRELTERTGIAARYCTNMLESVGLCDDLKEDMLRSSKRVISDMKHQITFQGEHHLKELNPRRRLDLFLFYKECLTNILRHSRATEVVTLMVADTEQVNLKISDNGHGMDGVSEFPIPRSLKRRARLLDGQVTIKSYAANGITVELSFRIKKQSLFARFGFLTRKRV